MSRQITSVMAFDTKRFSTEILSMSAEQVWMSNTFYVDEIHPADLLHIRKLGPSMMIDAKKLLDAGIEYIVITTAEVK